MWEDARLGFDHPGSWERVALVSDVDWVRHLVRAFGWLVPGDFRLFPLAERGAAEQWIVAP